ncbi:MAG: hypothetical protein V1648_00260 [Candidatus Aenigmatarchaeota archaeon]
MKMKGDFEYLNITLALLIFMGTVVLMVLMIQGNLLSFSGNLTELNQVTAIEAANMMSFCLSNMEDGDATTIPAALLDKYSSQDLAKVCGLDKPSIRLAIEDVESGKKWVFGGPVSSPKHEIWVSISYETTAGRTVNMGKMYVEM